MRHGFGSAFAIAIAVSPIPAWGALEPPDVEASEVLIHAQGNDMVFLTESLPWVPGDSLNYQMSSDYNLGTFAYHTNPGQTVGGNLFDLSVDGARDTGTGDWTWFGVAHWGGQTIDIEGELEGDTSEFPPQDQWHWAKGKWVHKDPGPPPVETTYELRQWVKWKKDPDHPGTYLSQSDYFYVAKNGVDVGKAKGDDKYVRGVGWSFNNVTLTLTPAKGKAVAGLTDSGTGIAGTFTQTLEAVPEPTSLVALALGLAAAARRRRAR